MDFQIPQLTAAERERVQQAEDVLSEVARLDAALTSKEKDIKSAEAKKIDVAARLAERDTDLALATSEAAAVAIEQDVKRLTGELSEAQQNLDRQLRIRGALHERLSAAEAALAKERADFESFVQMHRGQVINALGDNIAAAARPLIKALQFALVASSVSGGGVQARLADMNLPDIRDSGHLLLGLNMSAYVDGARLPLNDPGSDAQLGELARTVGEPRRTLAKLISHALRAERRQAPVHDTTSRGRTPGSQRRIDHD
jgi:hypothetical protein